MMVRFLLRFFEAVVWNLKIVTLGCSAVVAALLAAPQLYVIDLLSNFKFQLMSLNVLSAVVLALHKKSRAWAALPLVLAVYISLAMLPYYSFHRAEAQNVSSRLVTASINIFGGSLVRGELLDYLKGQAFDLVALQEVDSEIFAALQDLEGTYPHMIRGPIGDSGIALLSRYPLRSSKLVQYDPGRPPAVCADLDFHGSSIRVVATHPAPPSSRAKFLSRNLHLELLPKLLAEGHDHRGRILMGDLNITPWSFYFRRLLVSTGLKDAREGFGYQPSWPVDNFFLRVAIDQILTDLPVARFSRIDAPGSDHFGVKAELDVGSDAPLVPPNAPLL